MLLGTASVPLRDRITLMTQLTRRYSDGSYCGLQRQQSLGAHRPSSLLLISIK